MKLDWVKTQKDWVNNYESYIKTLLVSVDYIATKTKQSVHHMKIMFDQEKMNREHIDRDTILDAIETWHGFFIKEMTFINTLRGHYQDLVVELSKIELAILKKNLLQLESQGREYFDASDVVTRLSELHRINPTLSELSSAEVAPRAWQRDPREDEHEEEE